ncbi:MAG: GAF domain-containing protein, partial [Anaerolineales bacterium]
SKKPVLASIAEINPILLQGKIEIESDLYEKSSLNRFEKRLQAEGMCAYVNAPLLTQGKLIGTLSLAANTPDAFSEINIEIIREAAHQLAIAIQSTRLLEETRRRALHLQVGAEIARDIARAKDLDELINTAVNLVRDRFGFYHAGIFLVDEKREYAVLKAATGKAGQKMLEHGHQLKVGEVGIVGYVTGTGTPRIALDVGADAVHFKNPFLPETRSEMALPLKIGTHVIGALDVQSKQPAAFDNDDIATLHTMADQLTIAFENTRLYLTATRRADELNVLMRLGHAISANLNLNTILETTYQCVGNLMPNDAFWIASYKSGDTHYHYLLKIDQEIRYSFPDHSSIEKGLGGCTIQNKTPMRFNSRSEPRPFTQVHYGDSTPVESVICVPLLLGGQVIGAMSTQSYTPNAFTQSELNLLQKLAEPVAIALQNSQLFEATRRQLEELTLLHAIANAGTEATTEDTLIERVTTIIGNTLYPTYPGRPDNFGIMMVDEDAGVVKTHPSYRGIHSICQIGDGITGKVAQDG